ncbi:hypothetical protein CLAFUW4_05329 [Fulvia fulva]|uniref:Domain of unknown function at the cortex 1 domain-containing protein n=1 Tax=Passalora fulva TaxID=5499 RepID=A0A9Q8LHU0_PASFU|nr:uncharacterized protein CLAFUR5_05477 [Fulvia fulva]KAK4623600.1 hypothetical protein CLAFUR4_05323 [Fulvia fulva]KAK4625420.1 hypothetical protein CLAFUR0_05331 [Fulvia fulva]UJO17707.1 hypothetical protein CLAFUR5_05477 [Fulvia fulva]WPV14747.1 hypothetical protein CLAFUW4_05329 [Fulvia fulva]WPV29365.1 hypothetical protein CLAFUW7_05328 [Fulvia fulva]
MTSVKSKIARAAGRGGTDSVDSQEAEQYRLLVTAGPSYDLKQHKIIHVNTDTPTTIENEFLTVKINVRVRGFRGLPDTSPSTASYLEHPMHQKDQYSLGFSFVPKQDLPSVDTVWGNDLDHPIRDRIPPGFNTAFRIVKEFIDPGLSCDVYADEPWLYGPSLSCWFAFRIGDTYQEGQDFPAPGVLSDGSDGSGTAVRERLGIPDNNEKRRKFFLDAKNRESLVFEKGRLYQGDFYNPYLDFANFALKLPGFSLKVIKYIGEKTHCLRYVFKNRETGDIYFNVNFTLLWGEQLRKAQEEGQLEPEQATAGAENAISSENGTQNHDQASDSDKYPSAGSDEEGRVPATSHPAPPTMQLHPGDHTAAASDVASQAAVDDIDKLLRNTSTDQQRSGLFLDEID